MMISGGSILPKQSKKLKSAGGGISTKPLLQSVFSKCLKKIKQQAVDNQSVEPSKNDNNNQKHIFTLQGQIPNIQEPNTVQAVNPNNIHLINNEIKEGKPENQNSHSQANLLNNIIPSLVNGKLNIVEGITVAKKGGNSEARNKDGSLLSTSEIFKTNELNVESSTHVKKEIKGTIENGLKTPFDSLKNDTTAGINPLTANNLNDKKPETIENSLKTPFDSLKNDVSAGINSSTGKVVSDSKPETTIYSDKAILTKLANIVADSGFKNGEIMSIGIKSTPAVKTNSNSGMELLPKEYHGNKIVDKTVKKDNIIIGAEIASLHNDLISATDEAKKIPTGKSELKSSVETKDIKGNSQDKPIVAGLKADNNQTPEGFSQKELTGQSFHEQTKGQNNPVNESKILNSLQENNNNQTAKTVEQNILNQKIAEKTETLSNLRNDSVFKTPATIQQNVTLREVVPTTAQILRSMGDNSTQSVKLVLQPESLGKLIIDIVVTNNVADVKFKAESHETAKFIESQIPLLREKLSQQGIQTSNIDIGFKNQEKELFSQSGSQNNNGNSRDDKKTQKEFVNSFRNYRESKDSGSDDNILEKIRQLEERQLSINPA